MEPTSLTALKFRSSTVPAVLAGGFHKNHSFEIERFYFHVESSLEEPISPTAPKFYSICRVLTGGAREPHGPKPLQVWVFVDPIFQRLRGDLGFGEEDGMGLLILLEGRQDHLLEFHEFRVGVGWVLAHFFQYIPPVYYNNK